MNVNEYISFLRREKNILITVDEGNLKIRGEKEALTKDILEEIKSKKESILEYFKFLEKKNKKEEIRKTSEKKYYELSAGQKRLYFIQEFDKESIAYNQPIVVKLEGELDRVQIQNTFNKLIERHEVLRTSFINVNGAVFQEINNVEPLRINFLKVDGIAVDTEIADFIKPFNLSERNLIRVKVLSINKQNHFLIVDMHHIISDGVSQGILMKEFMQIYDNKELSSIELQYKDYVDWQINQQNKTEEKKEFWLNQYKEQPVALDLITDFTRPKNRNYKGGNVEFSIDETQTLALKMFSEKQGTTLYTTILSVLYVLLYKLTNQEDIIIGTPTSGRENSDMETIIGMFVNTLALRNYPKSNISFTDFLLEVKQNTLGCFDNQSYQYEELVNDLKLVRDTSRNALFDVMFTYQNYEVPEINLSNLSLKHYKNIHSDSIFDLHLMAFEVEDRMEFNFTFQTALFKKETIVRFTQYFKQIINEILRDNTIQLSNIDMLPNSERQLIVNQFNNSEINYSLNETIATVFEAQVKQTPNKIALRYKEQSLTYAQLEKRSRQLALFLQEKGVIENTLVGLCFNRSIEMIIAILGVARSGGAYVPIDPKYPQERIKYMIEDGILEGNKDAVKIVLTETVVEEKLLELAPKEIAIYSLTETWNEGGKLINSKEELESIVNPESIAYVIYTSGSTGKPKGVKVMQKNVVSLLKNKTTYFDFTEKDIWTLFHSYCFDFSVWEMYGALLFGGELIVVPEEVTKEPEFFAKLLHDQKVTVLNQTPQAFYMLQESYVLNYHKTDVRYVIFGGEALHPSKLRSWKASYSETKLINMYGITETTVHVTYKEIGVNEINLGISNIGKPLPTLNTYILDEKQNIVPVGVPGELYVSGAGVTKGYLNREKLTKERFITNPFTYENHEKLYRTGDLARWLSDGNIEYLGRIDTQVKIRGFRIELGEIEATLNRSELIEKSVVVAKNNAGTKQLIAYFESKKEVNIDVLRNELSQSLPSYMIPAFMVPIECIPLTSNGKVDRKKLINKELEVTGITEYMAPASEIQRLMVDVWKEALSITKIGVKDNFFALGGDSIKAIKLIYKINEILNCNLHVADMYAYQTIEELSLVIPDKQGNIVDDKAIADKEIKQFQDWYKEEVGFDESYEAVYPMSGIEKGMTFYTLLKDEDEDSFHNIIYHEQNLYSIPITNFRYDVFEKAIELLMEKHSTMRKVYDVEHFAHIIKKKMKPELFYVDISHMSMEEQQKFGLENKDKERVKSTDFSGEVPLWRMSVIKVREDYHYLLFDMHHSVLDGWSLYSFLTELKNTYVYLDKDPNYLPQKLQCDYYDQIIGEVMEINKNISTEYWRKELADYNRYTFYPTGNKHTFVTEILDLDLQLKKDLEKLASTLNTSLKHLCFAAYTYTLSKFNYEHDFVVGIITNTRPLVPDGERLLGCFLNAVPFRVNTSKANTWRDYISYIENKLIKMKRHEKIPLQKILEIIEEPAIDGNPLFDTSFNFVDFWVTEDILKYDSEIDFDHHTTRDMDFATDNLDVNQNTLFDFHIWSDMYGMQMILEYSTEILTAKDIEKFHTYFKSLLYTFVENVDELVKNNSIITPKEETKLLEEYNNTFEELNNKETLISLLKKQVVKNSNKVAVVHSEGELTYGDLDDRSEKIAMYIQKQGVKRGNLVGVMLERDASLMPVIYGIMKAGCAYVPIDPKHPSSRINLIIKDANLQAVITNSNYQYLNNFNLPIIDLSSSLLEIEEQIGTLPNIIQPDELAYVIYTSGSTGKPKGVMIEHQNVVNFINGVDKEIEFKKDSVFLSVTTISFDIFGLESLLPISKGCTMVLANEDQQQNPLSLIKLIEKNKINTLQLTPSRLELLFSENESNVILNQVSTIMVGGEAFPESLFKKLSNVFKGEVYNMYGPTETTIWSTIKNLTKAKKVTIGKPIANTEIYVLGKNKELLSDGVVGELHIGGKGLARGYYNNEKLTASRFIQSPFKNNEKIYATGDLVRWNAEGDLEFFGRIDYQVKIRGFRIELGEIENYLNQYSRLKQALVIAKETEGDKFLVAYYIADKEILQEDIKSYLSDKLPDYMIPDHYMFINELPLSPSGKIDRRALPDYVLLDKENYVAPRNEIEKKLTEIWSEVLKLNAEEISVAKSFFDLGGHSLRAMILINKINKEYQASFPLTLLFRMPTIKDMASFILGSSIHNSENSLQEEVEEFSF